MNRLLVVVLGIFPILHHAESSRIFRSSFDELNQKAVGTLLSNYRRDGRHSRFQVMKRSGPEDKEKGVDKKSDIVGTEFKDLDSVVVSLDTGAEIEKSSKNDKPDLVDKIGRLFRDMVTNESSPLMRVSEKYDIKPEIMNHRSGKPSLKLGLHSDSILKALKSLFTARVRRLLRRYADDFARKTAVVYRVIKDEIEKDGGEEEEDE